MTKPEVENTKNTKASKTELNLFQLQDKINETLTATLVFSESSYPMAVLRILHDRTGNIDSKMAAANAHNSSRRIYSWTFLTAGHVFGDGQATQLI